MKGFFFFFLLLSLNSSVFSSPMEKFEVPVEGLGTMTYVQQPLIASEKMLEADCLGNEKANPFGEELALSFEEASLSSPLTIGGRPVKPAGKTAGYFLYAPDQSEDLDTVETMASQANMNRVYGLLGSDSHDRRILTNKIYVAVKEGVTSDTFKEALTGDFDLEDLGYGEFYLNCKSENPLKEIVRLREDSRFKTLVDTIEPDFAVQAERY